MRAGQASGNASSGPPLLFGDRLRLTRSERAFGALQLLGQFFTHHGQLLRCFDANPHTTMANFDDGNRNLVANQNPLADFSTEN